MTHAFRKYFFSLLYQPGSSLLAIGLICYIVSLVTPWKLLLIPGLLILAFCCVWLRFIGRHRISPNFIMIRSVPVLEGPAHWMIFAEPTKANRKQPCRENLRSLREDRALMDALPAGNYTTITHKPFLKAIQQSERVTMMEPPEYLYSDTLQGVLKKMTGKRCKRCASRCHAWTAPPRKFYLVRFNVS